MVVFERKVYIFDGSSFFCSEIEKYAAIGAGEDFSNSALEMGQSAKEAVEFSYRFTHYTYGKIHEYVIDLKTGKLEK